MKALRRYAEFWDQREVADALAWVRICVGAVMLYDLLEIARLGLIVPLWAPTEDGGIGGVTYTAPRVLFYTWFGASARSAYALFSVAACAALAMTAGAFTRISAGLLMFCSAQFSALAPDADRGVDVLLRNALLLIALSGAGATWSVDARRLTGRIAPDVPLPAWPRYLLIAQLVLLYFSAGVLKQSSAWSSIGGYSALFTVLSKPHYARFQFTHEQLVALYPLLQLATIGTIIFERSAILVPILIWLRETAERGGRLRRWVVKGRVLEVWMAIGVLFHIALAAFTQLGIFPWGCLALYPALVRPERLRARLTFRAQGVAR